MAKYEVELTEQQKNGIEALFNAWWLAFNEEKVELKEIEPEPETKEWPQDTETYWYINSGGKAHGDYWNDCSEIDVDRKSIGNCFKTREEAEFEVERLKVIAELKKYAEPKERKTKYGVPHFVIMYVKKENRLVIDRFSTMFPVSISFETQETAEKAIEEVGADKIKKYLFGVNETALE